MDARVETLLSFYEKSSPENGPFGFGDRQSDLAAGLEALPLLLVDAKSGRISMSILDRLRVPVLYMIRVLALEWFTAALMKCMYPILL